MPRSARRSRFRLRIKAGRKTAFEKKFTAALKALLFHVTAGSVVASIPPKVPVLLPWGTKLVGGFAGRLGGISRLAGPLLKQLLQLGTRLVDHGRGKLLGRSLPFRRQLLYAHVEQDDILLKPAQRTFDSGNAKIVGQHAFSWPSVFCGFCIFQNAMRWIPHKSPGRYLRRQPNFAQVRPRAAVLTYSRWTSSDFPLRRRRDVLWRRGVLLQAVR